MPVASAVSLAALEDIYRGVGIDLAMAGAPIQKSPPFSREFPVGWTDSFFEDVRWYDRHPNPAKKFGRHVSFERLPEHHAWTAKFLVWALENADSALEATGRRCLTRAGTARHYVGLFRQLVDHVQGLAKTRLLDLTQDDVTTFMMWRCRLDGRATPIARSTAEDTLAMLKRLHTLGPAGSYYIPDGLSFDPEPVLEAIVGHRDLQGAGQTAEVAEETVHRLVNTAIRWVEDFGGPLLRLRALLDAYEAWRAKLAGGEITKDAALVIRFLTQHPEMLQQYEELRHAFPQPLDSYVGWSGTAPSAVDCGVIDAIERLKQAELEAIATSLPPEQHRVRFSAAIVAQEANIRKQSAYSTPWIRKAFEDARAEIEATLEARRKGEWPPRDGTKEASAASKDCGASEELRVYSEFRRIKVQVRGLAATMHGMCYAAMGVFNGWRISEILSVEADFLRSVAAGFELGSKVRKTGINPDAVTYRPVAPIVAQAVRLLAALNVSHFSDDERRLFRNNLGTAADLDNIDKALRMACGEAGVDDRIASHQFRRFFALFYMRRFQGNMDALRRHFRHVSRDMVWAYCRDIANAQYLARAQQTLALEITEGIVHGTSYRSRHVTDDIRSQYMARNLPPTEAERWLREQLRQSYRSVHASPWGYCMFQRGDIGAACDAKDEPVLAGAEPQTCGACKFLATGEENIEFWVTTALLHQEIVASQYHTPLLKDASVRMLKICRSIVALHGRDLPPVAEKELVGA